MWYLLVIILWTVFKFFGNLICFFLKYLCAIYTVIAPTLDMQKVRLRINEIKGFTIFKCQSQDDNQVFNHSDLDTKHSLDIFKISSDKSSIKYKHTKKDYISQQNGIYARLAQCMKTNQNNILYYLSFYKKIKSIHKKNPHS